MRAEEIARLLADRMPRSEWRRHLLTPLLAKGGLAEYRQDRIATALVNEQYLTVADEAVALLADRGIRCVPIKGAAYIRSLYSDPDERPMADIDLLVHPTSHRVSIDVLAHMDLRPLGGVLPSPIHHATTLVRRDVTVDLHQSITQIGRGRLSLDELWRRLESERGRLTLDPIDEALIHFIHIARSELIVPAISYVDSVLLLERLGPRGEQTLFERARRYRLQRAVAVAVAMTRALSGEARWSKRAPLPGPDEVLALTRLPRLRQIACKFALVDDLREAAWLAYVAAFEKLLPDRRLRGGSSRR